MGSFRILAGLCAARLVHDFERRAAAICSCLSLRFGGMAALRSKVRSSVTIYFNGSCDADGSFFHSVGRRRSDDGFLAYGAFFQSGLPTMCLITIPPRA
jgi:hypothetical protein